MPPAFCLPTPHFLLSASLLLLCAALQCDGMLTHYTHNEHPKYPDFPPNLEFVRHEEELSLQDIAAKKKAKKYISYKVVASHWGPQLQLEYLGTWGKQWAIIVQAEQAGDTSGDAYFWAHITSPLEPDTHHQYIAIRDEIVFAFIKNHMYDGKKLEDVVIDYSQKNGVAHAKLKDGDPRWYEH